jgi:hypothetical protein
VTIKIKLTDQGKPPFIRTTSRANGPGIEWAPALFWFDQEQGDWELWEIGQGRYATEFEAEIAGRYWAKDAGIRFICEGEEP